MKVTQLFVKTLREVPASAETPSHILLLRGGYVKQLAAGLYSILPMGKRVLHKIESILREEMEAIGGQEIDMPLVHPSELWKESGRFQAIGPELARFKDRGQHDMVLAMTHEEALTDLVRATISSYKQLPAMLYQIKLKFRDEPRSRGGLIRVREFMMKDAYSCHADEADLDAYYEKVYQAYLNIFNRVGIEPVVVQSDTGIMGGKVAHEFMLETETGEDYLILSEDGKYAANQEIAAFDREPHPEDPLPMEKIETPEAKTIQEISDFLGTEKWRHMKAVLYARDLEARAPRDNGVQKQLVMVLLRGDLDVSEIKVKNYLKTPTLVSAEEAFIRSFGIIPGYASAVGIPTRPDLLVLVDESITQGNNFVGGANEEGMHYKNVNYGRDFKSDCVGDFALANSGHKCVDSQSRLKATRGIEIGNIFKLGTKFSTSMGAQYLNKAGKGCPVVMGCYGIGVGRLMAAVVECYHDKFGPLWPKSVAPYQVHLLNIGGEPEVMAACDGLYRNLTEAGWEVLFDDRDERPGVKFKDADLWGAPVRIALSAKTLAESSCEWKLRAEKGFTLLPLDTVPGKIREFFDE